ncbi:MAG: protein BatD [Gammaproteobacteria bacterium]|nr:protein BatD [Gammaproteobacteria bacterium]
MTSYLCAIVLLCCSQIQAATFQATVDRTQLNSGESVELILESDDATQFLTPDLTPLENLFSILASKQVQRLSTQTQAERNVTQWVLTLQPKRTGSVIIPPLRLGQLQSSAINLYVKEATEHSVTPLEPVYIDTQLDQEWVYVQAQLILTLRIYHAIPLFADSNLTPLLLDNARVEQLGKPRTFEQHINGVRHGVIEIRYAIFPQQSGTLDIPAQVFSATLAGHNPYSLTPFTARPGQRVEVKSARITIQVQDIPSSYPADALWLPAQNISLKQEWTPSLNGSITAGSAVTRVLTLQAQGLPSSQLPELPSTQSANYSLYVDKPMLNHRYTEQGLLSQRDERQALIFQNSGSQKLAAIKLPWWNTQTDQLEYAQLPEQTLLVSALPASQSPLEITTLGSAPTLSVLNPKQLKFWQMLTGFFMLLSLLGFTLWWRARHQPAVIIANNSQSQRSLHDDLKRACLSNDPVSTRQALDAWARQHPESLADMAARDPTLSDALDTLNSALYSESNSHWQGKELWLAIVQLSFSTAENSDDETQLPPLYPP